MGSGAILSRPACLSKAPRCAGGGLGADSFILAAVTFLKFAAIAAVVSLVSAGCSSSSSGPGAAKVPAGAKSSGGKHATIDTTQGPIEIEFLESTAPRAVENFRLLAEHGYYNGLTFHRVVKGFMLQGGDPTGTGMGGESAWGGSFPDEIDRQAAAYQDGYRRGIVAMANAGPNTNGSQFFIMHMDYPLPPDYVIFARVTSGMSAVDAIAETKTTMGDDGAMSKPETPQVMKSVTVKP
jgi:cyclophilin family peptidyl-prolyl cis-trans isomerase